MRTHSRSFVEPPLPNADFPKRTRRSRGARWATNDQRAHRQTAEGTPWLKPPPHAGARANRGARKCRT